MLAHTPFRDDKPHLHHQHSNILRGDYALHSKKDQEQMIISRNVNAIDSFPAQRRVGGRAQTADHKKTVFALENSRSPKARPKESEVMYRWKPKDDAKGIHKYVSDDELSASSSILTPSSSDLSDKENSNVSMRIVTANGKISNADRSSRQATEEESLQMTSRGPIRSTLNLSLSPLSVSGLTNVSKQSQNVIVNRSTTIEETAKLKRSHDKNNTINKTIETVDRFHSSSHPYGVSPSPSRSQSNGNTQENNLTTTSSSSTRSRRGLSSSSSPSLSLSRSRNHQQLTANNNSVTHEPTRFVSPSLSFASTLQTTPSFTEKMADGENKYYAYFPSENVGSLMITNDIIESEGSPLTSVKSILKPSSNLFLTDSKPLSSPTSPPMDQKIENSRSGVVAHGPSSRTLQNSAGTLVEYNRDAVKTSSLSSGWEENSDQQQHFVVGEHNPLARGWGADQHSWLLEEAPSPLVPTPRTINIDGGNNNLAVGHHQAPHSHSPPFPLSVLFSPIVDSSTARDTFLRANAQPSDPSPLEQQQKAVAEGEEQFVENVTSIKIDDDRKLKNSLFREVRNGENGEQRLEKRMPPTAYYRGSLTPQDPMSEAETHHGTTASFREEVSSVKEIESDPFLPITRSRNESGVWLISRDSYSQKHVSSPNNADVEANPIPSQRESFKASPSTRNLLSSYTYEGGVEEAHDTLIEMFQPVNELGDDENYDEPSLSPHRTSVFFNVSDITPFEDGTISGGVQVGPESSVYHHHHHRQRGHNPIGWTQANVSAHFHENVLPSSSSEAPSANVYDPHTSRGAQPWENTSERPKEIHRLLAAAKGAMVAAVWLIDEANKIHDERPREVGEGTKGGDAPQSHNTHGALEKKGSPQRAIGIDYLSSENQSDSGRGAVQHPPREGLFSVPIEASIISNPPTLIRIRDDNDDYRTAAPRKKVEIRTPPTDGDQHSQLHAARTQTRSVETHGQEEVNGHHLRERKRSFSVRSRRQSLEPSSADGSSDTNERSRSGGPLPRSKAASRSSSSAAATDRSLSKMTKRTSRHATPKENELPSSVTRSKKHVYTYIYVNKQASPSAIATHPCPPSRIPSPYAAAHSSKPMSTAKRTAPLIPLRVTVNTKNNEDNADHDDRDDAVSVITIKSTTSSLTTRSVGGKSYLSVNVDPDLRKKRRDLMKNKGW